MNRITKTCIFIFRCNWNSLISILVRTIIISIDIISVHNDHYIFIF